MTSDTRLPDFLIIGRMKSGTTTLARWLADHPGVHFSRIKEPGFFNSDLYTTKGLSWYRDLFKGAGDDQVLGEGTQSYTRPGLSEIAAERIAAIIPGARLIYLLRDPEERIRSHYRHRRIWRDEDRRFLEVVSDPNNDLVQHSMYYTCLEPFIERFPRDQILVARMEDLIDGGPVWRDVLEHLGLPLRHAPTEAHNVSEEKGISRPAMRLFRKAIHKRRLSWMPRRMREAGKRALRRRGDEFEAMLEDSRSPIPPDVLGPVWEDTARLESWLGRDRPLWERQATGSHGRAGP